MEISVRKISKPLKLDNILKIDSNTTSDQGVYFPNTYVRMAIVGPSETGKTTLLLAILTETEGLKFTDIYLFCNTLHQCKYKFLQSVIDQIPEITLHICSEDSCPSFENMRSGSCIIFDDFIHPVMTSFFTRSRHFKLNVIVLTQSYLFLKKHEIRENLNYLILFKVDLLTMKYIFNEHLIGRISFDIFVKLKRKANKFLAIDLKRNKFFSDFKEELLLTK